MLGLRSLKSRIIVVFVTLALLPFLVASFLLQRRADRVLEGVVAQNATATAASVGEGLEALVSRAFREGSAYLEGVESFAADANVLAQGPIAERPTPGPGIRGVRVLDGSGTVRHEWRAADPSFRGMICAEPGSTPFVAGKVGLIPDSPDWMIEVAVDPHHVFSRSDATTLFGAGIIEVADESSLVTQAEHCPPPLGLQAGSDPLESAEDVTSWLTDELWTVRVHADAALFGPTLFGLNAMLGVIALSVGGIATLLFAMSVGDLTRSLRQLTTAADRIGEGDFDTWLPPPGDDEAGRLSAALNTMMTRVDQSMERVKRAGQMAAVGEVASYMTHEIRNPLSSLKLNLQSLERTEYGRSLTPSSQRSLEICLREIDRLESVASGVLRLSRLESAGSLDLSWGHAVLREACELLQPEFDRRNVHVHFELDASDDTIRCDAQRLEAVFINLLLNAAEAMPSGGSIWVSTTNTLVDRRPHLSIRVADSGAGVPAELRSRIFEPFFTTREGGSGVGLSVAAQTIHDQGGTIELGARISVLEGAVFIVTLPNHVELDEDGQEPDTYDWPFPGKRTSPATKRGLRKPSTPDRSA